MFILPVIQLNFVSQKDMFKSWFQVTVNVALFRKRVFPELMMLKLGHTALVWVWIQWLMSLQEEDIFNIKDKERKDQMR